MDLQYSLIYFQQIQRKDEKSGVTIDYNNL